MRSVRGPPQLSLPSPGEPVSSASCRYQLVDVLSASVSVPAAGDAGVLREEPHPSLHG